MHRVLKIVSFIFSLSAASALYAQVGKSTEVDLQPFIEDVKRVEAALDLLGQPLTAREKDQLEGAYLGSSNADSASQIEATLDKHVIAIVTVNPESRVNVKRGEARPALIQESPQVFLVKVINQAGVTSPLHVDSPNNGPVYVPSSGNPTPNHRLTQADVRERWADIALSNQPPMSDERLSGLPLEYRLLTISSRDAGLRAAKVSFNVGQGTQDVGFLNEISIVFTIARARSIPLHVIDFDGKPTMASFIFLDSRGRLYPNPVKRLAPDFYFQPQVYRADKETIDLPPGTYTVTYSGGPEYISETQIFTVSNTVPEQLTFHLKRWINPEQFGWYSGDDHIHPAGCSHYENPSEGVAPSDMARQVRGEHLNVGSVLVWGPCFYYQSHFFNGREDSLASTPHSLLHYDLEVSGFPSSHAGHLVLLNLKNIMYPGTKHIEQWPTWDLPVLRWARSQGAVVGFAHSGWGLEVPTDQLPNYIVPGFDGIGANEYIVDVTYPDTVNFISLGDTPYVWELNIWYQTLNAGFRTRISGETDFPCIYDSRVGEGRTYANLRAPLTYDTYVAAVRDGAVYVSDGKSHLMNFQVNGIAVGSNNSEVKLAEPGNVNVGVTVSAYLPAKPNAAISELPYNQRPYWNLERARIGTTRTVPVEIVVNGQAVARKEIVANGSVKKLDFSIPIKSSSWLAVRILPSSHTNAMFLLVGGKQIQPSRRSVEWCLRSINQCWTQKAKKISPAELPQASAAYDHARSVYSKLLQESSDAQ